MSTQAQKHTKGQRGGESRAPTCLESRSQGYSCSALTLHSVYTGEDYGHYEKMVLYMTGQVISGRQFYKSHFLSIKEEDLVIVDI